MNTQLIEFKNHKNETLRALLNPAKNPIGVIFAPGFEETVVEYKFKNIVDKLDGKVNFFRFDFSGCGLSDGKFEDVSVAKLTKELEKAIAVFEKHCPNIKKIIVIAHSLGCATTLKLLATNQGKIAKAIFLAPAFNQQDLFRYWSVTTNNKDKEITWANFYKYFDEAIFDAQQREKKPMKKAHYISNLYDKENIAMDYQILFKDLPMDHENILIIHGDCDKAVPPESNDQLPKNIKIIKVKNGDHPLRRPDMVKQYLNKLTHFVLD